MSFDRITLSSQNMGGKACLREMGITVEWVADQLFHGVSPQETLSENPVLEAEDLIQALEYWCLYMYDTDFGCHRPLYLALWERNFALADWLVEMGSRLDDIIDEDGDSFLHRAASDGDIGMIQFFLSHPCPRTLDGFDYVANTPLMRAVSAGRLDIVKLLIAAGADLNANDESRIGNTAIRDAVYYGHLEIVRALLIAGADPTIRGWMNLSAVDEAYLRNKKRAAPSPVTLEIRRLFAKYPVPSWYNPDVKYRR